MSIETLRRQGLSGRWFVLSHKAPWLRLHAHDITLHTKLEPSKATTFALKTAVADAYEIDVITSTSDAVLRVAHR